MSLTEYFVKRETRATEVRLLIYSHHKQLLNKNVNCSLGSSEPAHIANCRTLSDIEMSFQSIVGPFISN